MLVHQVLNALVALNYHLYMGSGEAQIIQTLSSHVQISHHACQTLSARKGIKGYYAQSVKIKLEIRFMVDSHLPHVGNANLWQFNY